MAEEESAQASKEEEKETKEMSSALQKLKATPVKFGKFARPGDKVAIIGTIKEIHQQEGEPVLHLSVDDSKGMPIIIAPNLVEVVASPRPI